MTTAQNNQLSEPPVKTETLLSTPAPENGPGIGFFAVGMVVNITLIIAFFIWAYKQGRKREK
jgi:hypothetical protein